jgi:hypothetical protein
MVLQEYIIPLQGVALHKQGVTVFHSALTQEKCNNDLLTKRCLIGVSAGSLLVGASRRARVHASQHPRYTDLLSFPKETCASALAIPTIAVLVVVTLYSTTCKGNLSTHSLEKGVFLTNGRLLLILDIMTMNNRPL